MAEHAAGELLELRPKGWRARLHRWFPIVIKIKMGKNLNPKVIVMNRQIFDYYQRCEYVALREAGSGWLGQNPKHVAKHMRRFNPRSDL
jgi:hypothetical protein